MSSLLDFIPSDFNNYYEPFIGGGALFFEIRNRANNCFLSDINLELIITYNVIKKDLDKLIAALEIHKQKHCKEYYLKIRSKHHSKDPIEKARFFQKCYEHSRSKTA